MSPDSPAPSRQSGWNLPDAVASAIDADVVPRLLLSHRVGPVSPEQVRRATEELSDSEVERLVELLRGAPDREMTDFVDDLLERGLAADVIYLDLLAPAARRLGDMWCDDTCTFVEVSVALGRLQKILRSLSQFASEAVSPAADAPRVLVVGASGEQHTLGMFIVAELLVADGWLVDVGPPFVDSRLDRVVRECSYDVVGFSAACDTRLDVLAEDIRQTRRASRNPRVQILAGGRPFTENPALCEAIGADGMASDARDAPRAARELLSRSRVPA
jgi:MerR family transcriptional regulator, light-induced transcriptional regulator